MATTNSRTEARLLCVKEAASLLGVSRQTLYGMVKAGRIRTLRLRTPNSPHRFRRADIEAVLTAEATSPGINQFL